MSTMTKLGLTVILSLWSLLTHAATPIFQITPVSKPASVVYPGQTTTAVYQITNNTPYTLNNNGLIRIPAGLSQTSTAPGSGYCSNPFNLAPHASCLLALLITADQMTGPIQQGPIIANTINNPIYISQPSPKDALSITKGGALASITVSPTDPTISISATQQFTATGHYSDGATLDITTLVTWSSSYPFIAIILNSPGSQGLAIPVLSGASTPIIASLGDISGNTTLTISGATLQSIAVTPTNPTIHTLTTEQFTATGTFSDGTTQNLTTSVTWSSSNTSNATISNTAGSQGLATGLSTGSTTITAAVNGISGTTTLTIAAASLVSINVTPTNPTIEGTTTQQFTAVGTYSDNVTQDLTTLVTWSSSNPSAATISNSVGSQGLARGVSAGNTTIMALFNGVSGTTRLTVAAATLQSITVTPTNPRNNGLTTQQFTATGNYSDGTTQNITTSVTWDSSDPFVAIISNTAGTQGLATPVAPAGSTVISASLGAVSGSTILTISGAPLQSITVTPTNPTIHGTTTQQFTATGTYFDGTTEDLTTSVTWSSSDITKAAISNAAGSQGLATGISTGSTTITATFHGVSGTTTLTVAAAILESIDVTPINPTIEGVSTQQFTATGTYSDSTTLNLTTEVTWSSSAPSVASISNAAGSQGLATAVTLTGGSSTITATLDGVQGNTLLTVMAQSIASISISAGTPLELTASGPSGTMTIVNHSTVVTATNIQANFTGTALNGNVTQNASGCSSVAPLQSCTLTFTPGSTAVALTSFPIQGSNTTSVTGQIQIVTSSSCGDCTNACGAEQVICCAAQALSETPLTFYNTQLFALANQDGFCSAAFSGGSQLQSYYYSTFCGTEKGTYYSYANFIAAANSSSYFNGAGNFACATTPDVELSTFLATIALETTSGPPYTNTGLYFRYENGAIGNACSSTPGATGSQSCTTYPGTAPYTVYYPLDNYLVVGNASTQMVNTHYLYYQTGTGPGSVTQYDLSTSPMTISFIDSSQLPSGTIQLNDPNLISPGLWVGLGATQLTGISLFQFFGWYYQNLAPGAPVASANFPNFVNQYLVDGVLGFQGAFWYWMERVSGYGYRTIHQLFIGSDRPVCQDIAAVTLQINGGCNNYNPGRYNYFEYFNELFTGQSTPSDYACTYNSTLLNSLVCEDSLLAYCQPAVSPGPCTPS